MPCAALNSAQPAPPYAIEPEEIAEIVAEQPSLLWVRAKRVLQICVLTLERLKPAEQAVGLAGMSTREAPLPALRHSHS